MKSGKTVALRMLGPLLTHLHSQGIEMAGLLAEFELNLGLLFEPTTRTPMSTVLAIFRRAIELTGDHAIGLHAAVRVQAPLLMLPRTEDRYPIAQLLVRSPTAGAGLKHYVHNFDLVSGAARFTLEQSAGSAVVRFVTDDSVAKKEDLGLRAFIEFHIGLLIRLLHELSEQQVQPRWTRFAHPQLAPDADYAGILTSKVQFAAKDSGFSLAASQLAIPLRSADPQALEQLLQRIAQLRSEQESEVDLSGRVRSILMARIHDRAYGQEQLAKQLGMSVRTLTRRLAGEATSYQALLDEVRALLAKRYLAERQLSAEQLAQRLGFSATSAFLRAFRRWYGRSLSTYRRDLDS
jgi:AraC-like DNA-binding protein